MRKYCTKPLPHWCLTDLQPAFYETESGSAIQMVARVYKKIEELVCNYNSFVDEINRYVEEFESGMIADFDCFKNCIIKTVNDYIETIDTKINLQDAAIEAKFAEQDDVIAGAVQYMKDHIVATTSELFQEAIAAGTITAELDVDYDASTEAMTLSINATNGGE